MIHQVERQREIIDRRALLAALEALAEDAAEPPRLRVVEILRQALQQGRAEVRQRFEASGDGTETVRALSFLMDQLIRVLYDFVGSHVYPLANPTAGEHMAVVAVGGYGRGELAPYSDIDLLFLLPYKPTPHTEQVVEYMLYAFWDLGLKVGQATRSVDETLRQAQADLTIRTAVLEARYIWGDQKLFQDLKRRFESEIIRRTAAEFVQAKLAERDQRHQRMGDSRYVVEPNVKEGKGGLRDLQTLFWIAKYIYRVDDVEPLVEQGVLSGKEAHRFERAQNFLWTVRCHLHYLTERAEDRLTFDLQSEIGRRMGYTDHAGCARRRALHEALFPRRQGCRRSDAHLLRPARARAGAAAALHLAPLGPAQALDRGLRRRWRPARRGQRALLPRRSRSTCCASSMWRSNTGSTSIPHALRLITQSLKLVDAKLRADPEANRLFLEMLTSRKEPEITLRRLNEAGVFGRFMPDFGRVVAQMQYDMYHVYTVDEHTIFAIGILAQDRGRASSPTSCRSPPRSSTPSTAAARSMSRCCCTTSPRAAAATIRSSARRWPSGWVRASSSAPRRSRRWRGWCASTC